MTRLGQSLEVVNENLKQQMKALEGPLAQVNDHIYICIYKNKKDIWYNF